MMLRALALTVVVFRWGVALKLQVFRNNPLGVMRGREYFVGLGTAWPVWMWWAEEC